MTIKGAKLSTQSNEDDSDIEGEFEMRLLDLQTQLARQLQLYQNLTAQQKDASNQFSSTELSSALLNVLYSNTRLSDNKQEEMLRKGQSIKSNHRKAKL